MSRVRDVEVRGGGVVEGQVWAGGAEGHVAGVEMAEPGPGLVGSVDCRAFANLLKILRRARVEMRMMMMTIVVVTALGRWMFMKDHDESTTVVFLISSATSVDGGDGGDALHMLAAWSPGCQ